MVVGVVSLAVFEAMDDVIRIIVSVTVERSRPGAVCLADFWVGDFSSMS